MDIQLERVINHAKEELDEITRLSDEGKLTDKGAFIRVFCLGKSLMGWYDEGTEEEQIQRIRQSNRVVMDALDGVSKMRAS